VYSVNSIWILVRIKMYIYIFAIILLIFGLLGPIIELIHFGYERNKVRKQNKKYYSSEKYYLS